MNDFSLRQRNFQQISNLLQHKLKLPQDLHQQAHAVYDFNGAALGSLPVLLRYADYHPQKNESVEYKQCRQNAVSIFASLLKECKSHLSDDTYISTEIRTALCILLSCYFYNHHLCDDEIIHDLLEYISDYRISLS